MTRGGYVSAVPQKQGGLIGGRLRYRCRGVYPWIVWSYSVNKSDIVAGN